MRFLADECCDSLIVSALRALDYDVLYIAEVEPGAVNGDILTRAIEPL